MMASLLRSRTRSRTPHAFDALIVLSAGASWADLIGTGRLDPSQESLPS
jgi:hypothetical protein